jgi:hypothetical protein
VHAGGPLRIATFGAQLCGDIFARLARDPSRMFSRRPRRGTALSMLGGASCALGKFGSPLSESQAHQSFSLKFIVRLSCVISQLNAPHTLGF